MRRSGIVLIIAALILPQQAWAIGAFVSGCANGGPLATPTGVSAAATAAATSVSATMQTVGQAIKMEQRKIVASINKNFEGQNAALRQIVAALGVSMEKMTNMRMFGPQSKAYGIGAVEGQFNSVMTGRTAEDRLAARFRDSLSEHTRRFKNLKEQNKYYQEKETAAISPAFFFPQNATLSAEQLDNALFAIKATIDPFPTPQLPEAYRERGGKLGYDAARKVKYSRLAMPAAVIGDIVSSYAPVMALGDWAEKMHENMGGQGVAPHVVDGKISPMGYIDLMVNVRFANQQWYAGESGIHAMTKTGLLREMLVMESVNMEMQRRQMRYMQQTAGLLAQDQAMEAGQQFNESLTDIYERVTR